MEKDFNNVIIRQRNPAIKLQCCSCSTLFMACFEHLNWALYAILSFGTCPKEGNEIPIRTAVILVAATKADTPSIAVSFYCAAWARKESTFPSPACHPKL